MRPIRITVYYPTCALDFQRPPRAAVLTTGNPNTWQVAAPAPEGRTRKYVLPRSERQSISLDNLIDATGEAWEI